MTPRPAGCTASISSAPEPQPTNNLPRAPRLCASLPGSSAPEAPASGTRASSSSNQAMCATQRRPLGHISAAVSGTSARTRLWHARADSRRSTFCRPPSPWGRKYSGPVGPAIRPCRRQWPAALLCPWPVLPAGPARGQPRSPIVPEIDGETHSPPPGLHPGAR